MRLISFIITTIIIGSFGLILLPFLIGFLLADESKKRFDCI